MTRKWGLALILFAWLAACTASLPPTEQATATRLSTFTRSFTVTSSYTPTAWPTSMPIPTSTPVFDPRHIQTATSSTPAICPIFNVSSSTPPLNINNSNVDVMKIYLDYLNSYGMDAFIKAMLPDHPFIVADLTNDGINEIILKDSVSFMIVGCKDGKYQPLLKFFYDRVAWPGHIEFIKDINGDGIPEIAFNTGYDSHAGHGYRLCEWDGSQFQNILADSYKQVNASGTLAFKDIDGDGIQELIIQSGIFSSGDISLIDLWPWRNITSIYKWNGHDYVLSAEEQNPPEYRFQAVQDGDRLFLSEEYDRALALYQQAITSAKLKWWSQEIPHYLFLVDEANNFHTAMPPPPVEDKNEYIALSAYSYFRIMLIYLIEGQNTSASEIFQLTQNRYLDNPYGKAYAEMAAAFWDEYADTQNLVSACSKAIAYSELHQNELLPYLDNTTETVNPLIFHGDQSLKYEPENICPFK